MLHNEKELLTQTAEGDENAFRQLFDHYWNHIYSVAFSLTKSAVISEEIVQDVFLKIWLNKEKLTSVTKFDAYLFTVARNHIYNELRKKTLEPLFVEHLEQHFSQSSSLPDQEMSFKETNQLINKLVEKLPSQQRAVFRLSRYEGFSHNKIAEELGISALTVKSHMTKALGYIRHFLQMH